MSAEIAIKIIDKGSGEILEQILQKNSQKKKRNPEEALYTFLKRNVFLKNSDRTGELPASIHKRISLKIQNKCQRMILEQFLQKLPS